jgi:hypothetical protein
VDNLIKLKGNVYISKNDPDFFQKYMSENSAFQKAFEESTVTIPQEQPIVPAEAIVDEKPDKRMNILKPILLGVLGAAVLFTGFSAVSGMTQQMPSTIAKNAVAVQNVSDLDLLKIAVVRNALDRYKESHGAYPQSLQNLVGNTPENGISFIPDGLSYSVDQTGGYNVIPVGIDGNCVCQPVPLKLAFYPETNELALVQGAEVLAKYPVASAKKGNELPFTTSEVSKRVVDPNGGKGVFGTRALALQDNFAIHGTNQEELVGDRVSHGCLRMKEADIEELYPYVALGTPFEVVKGVPSTPKYAKGLPDLGGKVDPAKEATPKLTYHWNG